MKKAAIISFVGVLLFMFTGCQHQMTAQERQNEYTSYQKWLLQFGSEESQFRVQTQNSKVTNMELVAKVWDDTALFYKNQKQEVVTESAKLNPELKAINDQLITIADLNQRMFEMDADEVRKHPGDAKTLMDQSNQSKDEIEKADKVYANSIAAYELKYNLKTN